MGEWGGGGRGGSGREEGGMVGGGRGGSRREYQESGVRGGQHGRKREAERWHVGEVMEGEG